MYLELNDASSIDGSISARERGPNLIFGTLIINLFAEYKYILTTQSQFGESSGTIRPIHIAYATYLDRTYLYYYWSCLDLKVTQNTCNFNWINVFYTC